MTKFKSKRVLVTGGCSGIGKIMARKALERGASVVVWDINQQSIDNTVAELSALGTIEGHRVDISQNDEVEAVARQVGAVDILINNAGIVVGKQFIEHSVEDINRTMSINTLGAIYVTRAFLGSMIEQKVGHVCNIASSAGMVGNPNMSLYAASKWAVVGWSDSLRLEMAKAKTGVKVTTIMPYYINTGMFDGVRSRIPILKPEKAAERIMRCIERNTKMRTLPRYLLSLTRTLQGILSIGAFDFAAGKVFGIYDTMNDFKGRAK